MSQTISAMRTTSEATAPTEEKQAAEFVTVTFPDGRTVELPLLTPRDGPKCIDVQGLFSKSGCFTYDPGFTSTASCCSSITYIDGPRGLLSHRGYRIEDLVEQCDFMEVSYLLLYGELPGPNAKILHEADLKRESMVHEQLIKFYQGFKSDAHPMAIMVGVVGSLSAFFHTGMDVHDPVHRADAAYRLIAKMPTIAAYAYKTSVGQPIVYPRDDLSYAENFLHMLFATPNKPYTVTATMAKAIETFLILHADHEQNASTSTVRIAGSSLANPFACIASGIATLWGPSHGGANEAVLRMLAEIGEVERIPEFIAKAKDKNDKFRLMGFGHRVYKNYDPRAKQMRVICYQVLRELGLEEDPLLGIAVALEKAALADEYFVKRKLFPNVDFYSGIVLKALGIPISMFTVLFAVSRTTGWISQWKEMIETPGLRIGRPRQLYLGETNRKVTPIASRRETVKDAVVESIKRERAQLQSQKALVRSISSGLHL